MSKKAEFVNWVNSLIKSQEGDPIEPNDDARLYWEAMCGASDVDKPTFTENGKLIIQFLKDNQGVEMWKAKDIAEGLLISSRAVSGAIRKLVTDGFVEKVGQDPVVYSITTKGKEVEIND